MAKRKKKTPELEPLPVHVPLPRVEVRPRDDFDISVPELFMQLSRQVSRPDYEYSTTLASNTNKRVIKPVVDVTVQRAINALSIVNPDVSQMVNNVIQLGNTGHFVEVIGGQSQQVKSAIDRVKDLSTRIYPISAGVDGLVNDMLAQLARTGALAPEMVLSDRLKNGVKDVVLIPVHTIRWVRDEKTGRMYLMQYLGDMYTHDVRDAGKDYIELNSETCTFYRLDGIDGSPYPIPPVMAALGNIKIQMSMMQNVSAICRKVGLVGFISILLKAPPMEPGETKDTYRGRLQTYVNEAANKLTSNYNDGIFVGFQNQHEVTHTSLTADLRGLQDVVQINEEQIFSGLKSDPAMHGRTYSTTETYAGVVFDKLLASLGTYTRLIKRFLERMYSYDLMTQNISVQRVKVTFKSAKPLNELLEQQAKAQKFDNHLKEFKIGMISWEDFNRKMGYDEPFLPDADLEALQPPKPEVVAADGKPVPKDDKKKEKKPAKTKNVLDKFLTPTDTVYRGVVDMRSHESKIVEGCYE